MEAIFITARMKSTRLPEKALIDVYDKPLLSYLVKRLQSNSGYPIYICTSENIQDDPLEDFAKREGIGCFRGSEEDVLQRYFKCAEHFSINSVYITYADEPFVDINLLKKTFMQMKSKEKIWVRNDDYLDGTFGYGFTFGALKIINELKTTNENEVWGDMVSKMPLDIVKNHSPYSFPKDKVRLTVDYPEDLKVFKLLIKDLGRSFMQASLEEIIDIYSKNKLFEINGFKSKEYNKRIKEQSV